MLRRNVLIFQAGGLGDFILTWPFAVGIGRIYPQSRIIYVTHQQKGDLAKRVLRLEATDIEAGWHGLFSDDGNLPAAAKLMLESAHAVYSFLPVTPTWHRNIERINPLAKRVEIDTKLPADFSGHLTDRMTQALQHFAPERAATEQMLRSIADRGIGFKPTGGNDIVIHPGSGSPAKCWPIDRYIALAQALKTNGFNVRFVTGEVERDRWNEQDFQRIKQVATIRRSGTLIELLNEISTANVFVGNDSGPAHLAGIIGVDTVALFGPTDSVQWKPLGPHVKIINCQPLDSLPVDDVLKLIV